jgi:hypothetical protein
MGSVGLSVCECVSRCQWGCIQHDDRALDTDVRKTMYVCCGMCESKQQHGGKDISVLVELAQSVRSMLLVLLDVRVTEREKEREETERGWSHGPWCRPLDPNSKQHQQQPRVFVCIHCTHIVSYLPFGLFLFLDPLILHFFSLLHPASHFQLFLFHHPLQHPHCATHHLSFFFLFLQS